MRIIEPSRTSKKQYGVSVCAMLLFSSIRTTRCREVSNTYVVQLWIEAIEVLGHPMGKVRIHVSGLMKG